MTTQRRDMCTLCLPCSLCTHPLTCYCTICANTDDSSSFSPPHAHFLVVASPYILKYAAENCYSSTLRTLVQACICHRPPKGYRNHLAALRCYLGPAVLASFLLYILLLWGCPLPRNTSKPPQNKKERDHHLSPCRLVCELLLCCASFMPC